MCVVLRNSQSRAPATSKYWTNCENMLCSASFTLSFFLSQCCAVYVRVISFNLIFGFFLRWTHWFDWLGRDGFTFATYIITIVFYFLNNFNYCVHVQETWLSPSFPSVFLSTKLITFASTKRIFIEETVSPDYVLQKASVCRNNGHFLISIQQLWTLNFTFDVWTLFRCSDCNLLFVHLYEILCNILWQIDREKST